MEKKHIEGFEFYGVDGELLSISKCVCGKEFDYWEQALGIYPEHPTVCPGCGRMFYFRNEIKVFEVKEVENGYNH